MQIAKLIVPTDQASATADLGALVLPELSNQTFIYGAHGPQLTWTETGIADCGRATRNAWGYAYEDGQARATYFLR